MSRVIADYKTETGENNTRRMHENNMRTSLSLIELLLPASIGRLTVIVLGILIARCIKRRYFTALSSIPGPFAASVTRGWRVKEVYYGHVERTELKLHELYGMD